MAQNIQTPEIAPTIPTETQQTPVMPTVEPIAPQEATPEPIAPVAPMPEEPAMPTVEPTMPVQPEMPNIQTAAPVEQPFVEQAPVQPQPTTGPVIYGGANPLENTQSIPISNLAGQQNVVQTPQPEPTMVTPQVAPVTETNNIGQ